LLYNKLDARKFFNPEAIRSSRTVVVAGVCFYGEYSWSVLKIPSLLVSLHDLE